MSLVDDIGCFHTVVVSVKIKYRAAECSKITSKLIIRTVIECLELIVPDTDCYQCYRISLRDSAVIFGHTRYRAQSSNLSKV